MSESMKYFEIQGIFTQKGKEKKFSKRIKALNENRAREQALSIMGSKHRLKRVHIKIEKISETKKGE